MVVVSVVVGLREQVLRGLIELVLNGGERLQFLVVIHLRVL